MFYVAVDLQCIILTGVKVIIYPTSINISGRDKTHVVHEYDSVQVNNNTKCCKIKLSQHLGWSRFLNFKLDTDKKYSKTVNVMKGRGQMSSSSVIAGLYSLMTRSPAHRSDSSNSEQYGCNPTFSHNVGCNGRVLLSAFLLIDSTGRGTVNLLQFIHKVVLYKKGTDSG